MGTLDGRVALVTGAGRLHGIVGHAEGRRRQLERIPMGRAATDGEVVGLIAFLCSPAPAFMTGRSVNIDGGVVMW